MLLTPLMAAGQNCEAGVPRVEGSLKGGVHGVPVSRLVLNVHSCLPLMFLFRE